MSKSRNVLGWAGIVILALAHGLLEDLVFINLLVPNLPMSWDLTGNLFFPFTVPLAQLVTLCITGPFAWFALSLWHLPRLIAFWAIWVFARTVVLSVFKNPAEDIVIYLLWITLWCFLIGLLARLRSNSRSGIAT